MEKSIRYFLAKQFLSRRTLFVIPFNSSNVCSYPAKYSLFVESKDSPKKAHIKKFEGIRTPDLKIIKLQRQQVPTGLNY